MYCVTAANLARWFPDELLTNPLRLQRVDPASPLDLVRLRARHRRASGGRDRAAALSRHRQGCFERAAGSGVRDRPARRKPALKQPALWMRSRGRGGR